MSVVSKFIQSSVPAWCRYKTDDVLWVLIFLYSSHILIFSCCLSNVFCVVRHAWISANHLVLKMTIFTELRMICCFYGLWTAWMSCMPGRHVLKCWSFCCLLAQTLNTRSTKLFHNVGFNLALMRASSSLAFAIAASCKSKNKTNNSVTKFRFSLN